MGLLLALHGKAVWWPASHQTWCKGIEAALRADAGGPHTIAGVPWDVADDPVRQTAIVSELTSFGLSARLLMFNGGYDVIFPHLPHDLDVLTARVGHRAWFERIAVAFVRAASQAA